MSDQTNENAVQENLSLAQWAKTQDATMDELKILIAVQGVLDWDTYCGKFENSSQPLDRGRQTSLAGMLQQKRAIGVKIPLETIARVTRTDTEAVARLALLPEHADARDPDGGHILSTGLHKFLLSVDALKSGDRDLAARLPDLPAPDATAASEPPAGQDQPDTPATSAPEQETDEAPEGGPGDDPEKTEMEDNGAPAPEPVPEPEEAPEEAPTQPPAPARSKAKPDAKGKPSRAPRTKYSVNKADLNRMLQDTSEKPFDIRKTREFLMALPEYKPQDVALMLDDEAVKLFQNEYVSISVTSGSMILHRRNYQALLDLLNGNAYIMPDDQD